MPLEKGKSKDVIQRNISELIRAGHSEKQAVAIAYKEAANDEAPKESARVYDINDWPTMNRNPISKAGIFEYSGAQISPELEPDRLYKVWRPAEELSNPETIESFKLQPWIVQHTMLGSEEQGLTPAERKGVHGVIGEQVEFDEKTGILYANLKAFSERMKQLWEEGMIELSAGYRCVYELTSGVYNGEHYDAIQRKIRGNHLALVEEGRMGPDVAVMDGMKFTFDKLEISMADENKQTQDEELEVVAEKPAETEAQASNVEKKLDEVLDLLKKLLGAEKEEASAEAEAKTEAEEKTEALTNEDPVLDESEEKKEEKLEKAMDSKIGKAMAVVTKRVLSDVAKRDKVANALSNIVGVFDHSAKTLDEVVSYGMDKLNLTAPKGQELTALEAFLAGAKSSFPTRNASTAMDSATGTDSVSKYIQKLGAK